MTNNAGIISMDEKVMRGGTITESWYTQLVEDCKDIVTETEFTSRWALVEGYHQLGSRILTEYENFQRLRMPDSELVQRIAISIGRSDRTVYYAIQFARMYPDLNLLKEGKDISWSHIVNKYLTDGKESVKLKKIDYMNMIEEIKELLRVEEMKSQQDAWHKEFLSVNAFIRYLQDQVMRITTKVTNE